MQEVLEYKVYKNCKIDPSVEIEPGCIIGRPFRRLLDGGREEYSFTEIQERSFIGANSIIGTGTIIEKNVIIDCGVIIESNVTIKKNTLITYRSQICNESSIGENCIIGGFVGERTIIGNDCRIFGKIVHSQYDPSKSWDSDSSMECAPTIRNGAFIGFNAVICGDIVLGENSYICANALISRNVKPKHIAWGYNNIVHYSSFLGKLRWSPFFEKNND